MVLRRTPTGTQEIRQTPAPATPRITPKEQLYMNIYEVTVKAHLLEVVGKYGLDGSICVEFNRAVNQAVQHAVDIIRHRKDEE